MDTLPAEYFKLTDGQQVLLRLLALICLPTARTNLLKVAVAARSPGQDWTQASLAAALESLQADKWLDGQLTLPPGLRHLVTVEALDRPDAPRLLAAIASQLPDKDRSSLHYFRLMEDTHFLRTWRLAIYRNDQAAHLAAMELYNKLYAPERGPHFLDTLFRVAPLSAAWLSRLTPLLQCHLFAIRADGVLETGQVDGYWPGLLAHFRDVQREPVFAGLAPLLALLELLGLDLAALGARLAQMQDQAKDSWQGCLLFLTNQPESLASFHKVFKLVKRSGGTRRKVAGDITGLLYFLARLQSRDPDVIPELQAALEGVMNSPHEYDKGFMAVQALLWLARGRDEDAASLLARLRALPWLNPMSSALLTLAEYFVSPELVLQHIGVTSATFQRLRQALPLPAAILAEVLARVATPNTPYETYLNELAASGPRVAFTELLARKPAWERAMESLVSALRETPAVDASRSASGKRLAWLLDPTTKVIEPVEQSPKGANGWSVGRAISKKRLFEQNQLPPFLTDHDRRVLATLQRSSDWRGVDYWFDEPQALLALVGHPAIYDLRQREQRLELVAHPVELVVSDVRDGFRVNLSHNSGTPTVFLEQESPQRWRVIEYGQRALALRQILGPKGLSVPARAKEEVTRLLREPGLALPIRAETLAIDLPSTPGDATLVVQLQPLTPGLSGLIQVRPFGERGPLCHPGQGKETLQAVLDGQHQRALRDLALERANAAALLAACPTLQQVAEPGQAWEVEELESCLELLQELHAAPLPVRLEWPQGKPMRVGATVTANALKLELKRSRDWFHLQGSIQLEEGLVLKMGELLERLDQAQGRFIPLDDGRFVALTTHFQKLLARLRAVSETDQAGCRLPMAGALAVEELVEEAGQVKSDAHWRTLMERIRQAGTHRPRVPTTLRAELRDYQEEGFVWLSRLAHWGMGACLADDMGLGKTVQAIALLLEQAPHGPSLVVAPTSVGHNWEAELARFAPTLTVHRLAGAADRSALLAGLGPLEVVVVSYGLLHEAGLATTQWRVVVLDEAQAIKNADTRRAQASQKLPAAFRLALSGTPLENDLDELWSLFNVIVPGLLGSREAFLRRFAVPIQRDRAPHALQGLRSLIRPFILRRTKSAVLSELPPRTEVTMEVELPEEERAFYESLRRQALANLAALEGNAGQRRIHILSEITRLRRACCHPGLVDADTPLPGAKLGQFLELVEELLQNRHKALVFSQYVGQLERVRQALEARGVAFQYLDGSTPAKEREKRVKAFQAGAGDLFLISLKAGGLGLNLTAADYVIHLDPWWNPAVEDQASDRAHRIGQQRPVTIYRLITRDSIEEKIVQLHQDKRDLASDLLEGSEVASRLSDEELLNLLRGGE